MNPLALRRDELRGLHVNTHVPQGIAAARRYEISGDVRFHDVADYFFWEVVSARTYVTGGTSSSSLPSGVWTGSGVPATLETYDDVSLLLLFPIH